MIRAALTIFSFFIAYTHCDGQNIRIQVKNTQFYDVLYDEIQTADYEKEYYIIVKPIPFGYGQKLTNPSIFWIHDNSKLSYDISNNGDFIIHVRITDNLEKNNNNELTINDIQLYKNLKIGIKSGHFSNPLIGFMFDPNVTEQRIQSRLKFTNLAKEENIIRFTQELNSFIQSYIPFNDLIIPEVVNERAYPNLSKNLNQFEKSKVYGLLERRSFNADIKECIYAIQENPSDDFELDEDLIQSLKYYKEDDKTSHNGHYYRYLNDIVNTISLSYTTHHKLEKEITTTLDGIYKTKDYVKSNYPKQYLAIVEVKDDNKQLNDIQVLAIEWIIRNYDDSVRINVKRFKTDHSPTYNFLNDGRYVIWVADLKNERMSRDFTLPDEAKSKQIFCDGREFNAIIKLDPVLKQNPNIDFDEFYAKVHEMVEKYRFFYTYEITINL